MVPTVISHNVKCVASGTKIKYILDFGARIYDKQQINVCVTNIFRINNVVNQKI